WYNTNAGGNAQNLWANLMGKILCIDVNSGTPYSIPSDNPFATSSNFKKEIYAYGFRNPYRFSFDMGGDH
ncbi:MAG: PQQ-dependent sugar dehydrogenase, partial [Flavisolibacter sp.]|nr:PQQ-dependent sugar dehydrogenase [Flavisolibacter sp.]